MRTLIPTLDSPEPPTPSFDGRVVAWFVSAIPATRVR